MVGEPYSGKLKEAVISVFDHLESNSEGSGILGSEIVLDDR